MNRLVVPTPPAVASDRPEQTDTHLRGRRLLLARAAWLVAATVSVGLYAASVPVYLSYLRTACPFDVCASESIDPNTLLALEALGLSRTFLAAYSVALDLVFAAMYVAVAVLIFWRRSADRLALFVALALLTFGTATFPFAMEALTTMHQAWQLPVAVVHFLGTVSFSLFLYLFPDGRFVPRWTGWVALIWIAWQLPRYWLTDWPNLSTWTIVLNAAIWLGALGTVIYSQVYRYRRVSTSVQRQQTKWVVFGIVAALVGYIGVLLALSNVAPISAGTLLAHLVGFAISYLALLLIPLSIGIAMLRYHLFDVDVLINRTLVYAALTICIVGLYVLIVGSLGALFQASGNLLVSLVATGLVAVLFQPLRDRLQHGVNHLLYGDRDQPYVVLARLGQRLEATLAPEAVLPTIVETIAQALKLPYVAIALKQGEDLVIAAEHRDEVTRPALSTSAALSVNSAEGWQADKVNEASTLPDVTPSSPHPHTLSLAYQGTPIGQLVLGPRAPGEALSPVDRQLLDDLAHQVAVAAHAVRLTAELQQVAHDLQRSRERLVVAREEERRRLRRDLHDGLGPTLAALALSAGTITDLISANPEAAASLAKQLEADIRTTVGEIRRLIHGLRPPALDELGLVGAVRDRATQLTRRQQGGTAPGLHITVEALELPALPAAVEVAAYRIVEEALTNVVRHAQAGRCAVRLVLAAGLEVAIMDDGAGLPPAYQAGVGLHSMRERAEELGGEVRIEPGPHGGTRVRAWLPIPTNGDGESE